MASVRNHRFTGQIRNFAGQIRSFAKKEIEDLVTNDSETMFMCAGIYGKWVNCPTNVNKLARKMLLEVPYLSHEAKNADMLPLNPPLYPQRRKNSFDRYSFIYRFITKDLVRMITIDYRLALRKSLIMSKSVCFRGADKENGGTNRVFRVTDYGFLWDT